MLKTVQDGATAERTAIRAKVWSMRREADLAGATDVGETLAALEGWLKGRSGRYNARQGGLGKGKRLKSKT